MPTSIPMDELAAHYGRLTYKRDLPGAPSIGVARR
jgi:hypothetical protein